MNKTLYSKILLIFGIICYANGYLLNNICATFMGVFIFVYLYFTEKIVDFKIDIWVDKNVSLKEYTPTKMIFNIYKKSKSYLRFKSKHGIISSNILYGASSSDLHDKNTVKYLVNILPYKKGEFIIDIIGKIYDKRELNCIDYLKSFKFNVLPSIEGLKYRLQEGHIKSTISGFVEPEIDELKIYELGDDFKKIDWRKSLGKDLPIVRKLTHMEDYNIYYLLDIGYSMKISIDENKNKINYATGILLNLIKNSSENDTYLFLYDDYKIVKSSPINKKKIKNIRFSKNTIFQQHIEKELLNIKPILVDKYIPALSYPRKNYNNINENKKECIGNNIIHAYLSRKKKGSSGIFECARYLMKMKTGVVMIFTDLDSNIVPLLKSVNMLTKKGFRVVVYALYTPSFNIRGEAIYDEEVLREIYNHYLNRQRIIKMLGKKGIMVVDLSKKDGMKNVINKLKRCKI
ncbi:DUF58 domain-containing protein [Methanothermococcus sp.]|uniref:DUF58 domain-containing protein n=1 Tax=Methanothermococcus sp. TaxID=2614238 RepID=UPI0025EDC0B0|nr:DUF58 domain-containing protein [Methanothermococcus sp.]